MSKIYFPFNAQLIGGEPDRVANAETFAAYLKEFFTNGVITRESTSLQVYADEGNVIRIMPGVGFINGRIFIMDAAESLTLDIASASMNRIDRVVLRMDSANRMIDLALLKGNPSSTPIAPELTRDESVYELCLAEITIESASTDITQANIKDTRADSSICGIVSAAIKQIDTSTFYAQFNEQFNTWFESVKDQTQTGTLAGVQSSVNELKSRYDVHETDYNLHVKNVGFSSGTASAFTFTAENVVIEDFDNVMCIFHGENLAGATVQINDVLGTLYRSDGEPAKEGDLKSDIPYMLTYYSGKYFFKAGGGSEIRFTAGDAQLYRDTKSYSVTSQTVEKMKSIKIYASGSVRMKCTVYTDTYAELYLRVNGKNVETYIPDSGSDISYQKDISISPGDEIALWGKTNGNFGKFLAVETFEICTETGSIYEVLM